MSERSEIPVTLVIASAAEIVIHGLKAILQSMPEWKLCTQACTAPAAIHAAAEFHPDVLVLDAELQSETGEELTRAISKVSSGTKVLIISRDSSSKAAYDALVSGALGCIQLQDSSRDIIAAIRTIRENRFFFTSGVMDQLVQDLHSGLPSNFCQPKLQISNREREVLQLLADGKSSKDVAGDLHISVKTVESHRSNIMKKLNFHTVTDLVRYAIRNELVSVR